LEVWQKVNDYVPFKNFFGSAQREKDFMHPYKSFALHLLALRKGKSLHAYSKFFGSGQRQN
jgi:hypothetical protein